VKHECLPLCEAPSLYFAVKPDGTVDFRKTTAYPGIFSTLIFLNQLKTELKFIKKFKPDFVVSDSRVSSIIAAKLLNIPVSTVLNLYRVRIPRERRFLQLAQIADGGILTVIGMVWNMGEEVLIPDFPSPYTLSVFNLGIPPWRESKVKLIGPIIPVKPSDLPSKAEIRKKLEISEDESLVFISISGPSPEKRYLISMMREIVKKFPNGYRIVMSLAELNSPEEPVIEGNVAIYPWLHNRFELLKACDVVVARAGLGTISEAVCYGKPLVLVPTPSHTEQFNNAKRTETLKLGKVLDQRKLCYEKLSDTIEDVLTEPYTHRAEEAQKEVSKYDAIKTMVELISNHSRA
ncbi:MAG: glycosyltransferase, partial [Candidatus Bathyarchaeota archaeon]